MEFDLDNWCDRVSGLVKLRSGFWTADHISSVSFPDGGLSDLSGIEDTSFWFSHRNQFIEAVVRRYPPNGQIFDIGGGNGIVAQHLVKSGFGATVVEPDAAGAILARQRGLPVIAAAFQDINVPAGAVPAAGLFDVLEHIPEEDETLGALAHAIEPGGRLYISVPAYQFLWADEDEHSGHCRRYTLDRLSKVVTAAGFRVDYASYFFAPLVPLIFLMRTVPYRLGAKPTHDHSKVSRDHSLPDGLPGQALKRTLNFELARAKTGRCIPVGSSCLIAATRIVDQDAGRNPVEKSTAELAQ